MPTLDITILGSGSFFIDKNNTGAGYLIRYGDINILVDCGPGVLKQMGIMGFDPTKLDYIFITHLHSDHTSDLYALIKRLQITNDYVGKSCKNLTVYGPDGINDFIDKLGNIYGSKNGSKYTKAKYISLNNSSLNFDMFDVTSFCVIHSNIQALAYRFIFGSKIIVFSGDTVDCPGINKACANADLLFMDCALDKGYKKDLYHLSTSETGKICKHGNVKKVVLTNQLPENYHLDMTGQVSENFNGEVILAEDFMRFRFDA